MKRIFWGVLAAVGITLLAGGATYAVNTNNFFIRSYAIHYDLSKDTEGHSKLVTTETITAVFPRYDQNHGPERAIPTTYKGHPVHLTITAVTDENGTPLEHHILKDTDDVWILRIGNANSYVHGEHTYRITYTQHDITHTYEDTGRDEWYWDTNGTEWNVPIQKFAVTVNVDESIRSALQGEPYCYQGIAGATNLCEVSETTAGTYSTATSGLQPGENVSLAFGFSKGTFATYQPSLFESVVAIWKWVIFGTSIGGTITFIFLMIVRSRKYNRTAELHTIPVEYIPPKNTSVLVSSQVITPRGSGFSAQLIDLAVRHYIRIIETKPKATFSAAEYDLEIIRDLSSLLDEEQEILRDMFEGALPEVGARIALKSLRGNYGYMSRTMDNDRKLLLLIRGTYALRAKDPKTSKFFYGWAIGFLIVGVLSVSFVLLALAGALAVVGYMLRPLTDKGLELRRYLLGLDRYIKAAEAERLAFLQGPDTAEKVGERVDVHNPGQIVKLYERVLPYAILFGREKEWSKRLGEFYATTQSNPDWYVGSGVFNAALFASTMSSFSSAASYSGGSSSSSGGSSGGGSSGGGGGGGGGGGW